MKTTHGIMMIFMRKTKQAKYSSLTILPLGVLSGHADEYSKLVFGRITGCSPITPIPLYRGGNRCSYEHNIRVWHHKTIKLGKLNVITMTANFKLRIKN